MNAIRQAFEMIGRGVMFGVTLPFQIVDSAWESLSELLFGSQRQQQREAAAEAQRDRQVAQEKAEHTMKRELTRQATRVRKMAGMAPAERAEAIRKMAVGDTGKKLAPWVAKLSPAAWEAMSQATVGQITDHLLGNAAIQEVPPVVAAAREARVAEAKSAAEIRQADAALETSQAAGDADDLAALLSAMERGERQQASAVQQVAARRRLAELDGEEEEERMAFYPRFAPS
jgi:hypothetical protein